MILEHAALQTDLVYIQGASPEVSRIVLEIMPRLNIIQSHANKENLNKNT